MFGKNKNSPWKGPTYNEGEVEKKKIQISAVVVVGSFSEFIIRDILRRKKTYLTTPSFFDVIITRSNNSNEFIIGIDTRFDDKKAPLLVVYFSDKINTRVRINKNGCDVMSYMDF